MTQEAPQPSRADRRWIGAAFVTLVLAILSTVDQLNGAPNDRWLLGGLCLMGLAYLGENIADLIKAVRGG